MLHILTIAIRQIIHAFALAIKNSQILIFSKIIQKGENLVIILGLSLLFSGRKTSGLYLCFIIKKAHVKKLCKKACQKLNALVRIAPVMNVDKKRMIMKTFIESQFGYCPLVWLFHSRSLNNKINWIHEISLRITYNDRSSSFQNLLEKDNSVTLHHRNIKILATETYKFLQGLSPPLMNEIFVERNNNYSLRGNNILTRRRVNSVRYGTETVSFLAPKIWDILPKDIKDSESLDIFKRQIKKWI